ncbi:Protein of unknown function [Formivibrio citricus]|uniref:DUF2802 domain-containing protein n=1 Tax=Formivibrio citricus TaxID=83765 RepID=A0A1I4VBT0_9NEIS|nr:DUF2802 domain-containing protein [Formivibrio citricus]SFM98646.1 Protein of unknown function [Formivibrio citricus]
MDGIVITWPQLLYLGLILVLFYAAELLLFLRKSSQGKPREAQFRRQLESQAEEIAALRQEMESLKVRLASLQIQQIRHEPQEEEVQTGFVSEALHEDATPYNLAIRMAQSGADADQVAAGCGISRGEADLIVALYRSQT